MMRTWLTSLAPWMVLGAAMAQTATPVKVDFTFRGESPFDGVKVGEVCYAPSDMLRRWQFEVREQGNTAEIKAEGRTLHVELINLSGKKLVNLTQAVELLGGVGKFEGNKYRVLSQVRNVEATSEGLRIDAMMMVRFRAFRLAGPERLVIDLFGSQVAETASRNLPEGVRVNQFAPDVVRVVVDHPRMAEQPVPAFPPDRRFMVDLVHVGTSNIAVRPAPPTPPPSSTPPPEGQPMITVGDPTAVNETATEALFRVPLSTVGTTSPSAQYLNPNTIQVTIPNAQVPVNREGELGNGSYVTRSAISNDGRGNVVWLLTTSRAFAFRIGVNARNLDVRLIRPQGSNGTLTGKVIIVDAGHGGHDPGARAGGVNEKDLAMRIARFVATDLTTAGASIIMTREDDRFIELAERPAIANRSEADLFISVHINSNAVANSRSGSIMFYHMDSAMGGLLAALIDDELKQVSGIPSMGTRSDRTIYSTGFAVLRLSRMPAVLMELGFINHSTDRARMSQEQYQRAVAGAVTRAVRRYFAR